MNKLKSYKKVSADLLDVATILDTIAPKLDKSIRVTGDLIISKSSTDSQFIYALGIVNSRISACKALGINSDVLTKARNELITLHSDVKEYISYKDYSYELQTYQMGCYSLLSNSEKFKLLKYPKK